MTQIYIIDKINIEKNLLKLGLFGEHFPKRTSDHFVFSVVAGLWKMNPLLVDNIRRGSGIVRRSPRLPSTSRAFDL